MSEVPLLFNGDPLSKLEAQTGLGSPAGCAATEMIGLPGWSSMMFTAGVGEMSVTFRGKESIPDAHGFSDKDLLVGLETLDRCHIIAVYVDLGRELPWSAAAFSEADERGCISVPARV